MERICAVVVTYNRKLLLGGCLEALLAQTRPLDKILVIDNASSDGTAEMVRGSFPQVELVCLPTNTGGSGGFHTGIKQAFEEAFDWIWVMDDDVAAAPDTLDVMHGYGSISGFIHCRKHVGGEPLVWEGMWDIAAMERRCFPSDQSFANGRDWVAVNTGCFEGALIAREVVEKIGFPDPRFFIWGDDSVYGFLASRHTTVIYIRHIGFERKNYVPGAALTPRQCYFENRNRFLILEYFRAAGLPVSVPGLWLNILLQAAYSFSRKRHRNRWENLVAMCRGVRDGALGRWGRPAWI